MMENRPAIIIGPGEHIKDELDFLGWTQEDLAEVMGLSLKTVNLLINDKTPITFDISVKLTKAIGGSPETWLNLYNMYRARLVNMESEKNKEIQEKALLYQHLPIREMKKRKWIKPDKSFKGLKESLYSMFDVSDFSELNEMFSHKNLSPAFRKSEAYKNFNGFYAFTWFLIAKKLSELTEQKEYDKSKLIELVGMIPEYSFISGGIEKFLTDLESCGVKFLVLHHLPKTYIDGASFIDKKSPVIVYTKRYDRVDNFWFTVAHEIAHVLYHDLNSEKPFLDNLSDLERTTEEMEADKLAGKWLKKDSILNFFKGSYKYISENKVLECSNKYRIHPAIIVGILQHYKKLDRKNLNRFKVKVGESIPEKYYLENIL